MKQFKVESSDNDNKSQYKSFDEIDLYFDSSITPTVLKFIRNMDQHEHINLEFVDGSSAIVTKVKPGYPRWTVC
jgi:hypothetical protein